MKLLILLSSFALTACGFEVVDTGYRGIETNMGKIVGEPLLEGLHFYNPLTSDITEYQVREMKYEESIDVFTKDTQQAKITFAVTWNPDPLKVHLLYQKIGRENDVEEKVMKPMVIGSIKDAIGEINADELVGKREAATRKALLEIQENLATRNIFATGLQFTKLDFDDAYEAAVEAKVVATQKAQMEVNQTVQVREQAKQTVLTAEAEAQSMKIKSQALAQNQGLVQFEMVKKWDGVLPHIMFGNATPMINMQDLIKPGKK